MSDGFDCDVLIVGAGPSGLALAIELGTRGHRVEIIEQADRIGRQPRAKTTNVRTMEHMRRWGLAGKVRAASPLPADYANNVVFATGMDGYEIATFTNAFYADRVRDERFSESAQWIPQYEIEAVLRDKVLALPTCALKFGQTFTAFTQAADGVTAEIDAQGQARSLRARYCLGADGAASAMRKALGATMQGKGRIGQFLSLVLRIPHLAGKTTLPDALMYWLINPASPCVMGPMDRDGVWFWGTQLPPDAPLDEETNRLRVRKALPADVDFDILVTDIWSALSLQADRYADGRVFLVGDACHLHPPFGGYGMNLGIGDAVDLGWKLSAVLESWGGPRFLRAMKANGGRCTPASSTSPSKTWEC